MIHTRKIQLDDDILRNFGACRVFKDAICPIVNIDWSEDGDSLLVCEDDTLRVYTISTGDISRIHHSRKNIMDVIRFAHNNKQCLVASNKGENESAVRLWDIQENRYVRAVKLNSAVCRGTGLIIHPSRDLVLISCTDGKVLIFNFKLDTPLAIQQTKHKAPSCAFDLDGRVFVVSTEDHKLTLFDCKAYTTFDTFDLSKHIESHQYIEHVSFSIDGRLLLVKTNTGRLLSFGSFRGEFYKEYKLSDKSSSLLKSASIPTFSSDSQYIFYGLTDASVAVWSANTGEHITNFVGHVGQPRCLAFNPKKALFASAPYY
ncbi:hypothetical protein ACR3K2_07030 [Cryptosporidium serpentis]